MGETRGKDELGMKQAQNEQSEAGMQRDALGLGQRSVYLNSAALVLGFFLLALSSIHATDSPVRREWTVDGVVRQALVYAPSQARGEAAPVVFVFHGRGGTMHNAARNFGYHTLWPESIVVYPQGVPTPGVLIDLEGKMPGWQYGIGDHGDRDLKFFDAMLASLKEDYGVDEKRIYATGLSNGGAFTYLLWATRGDIFAAFAPCAAAAPQMARRFKPKPVLHLAGEKDSLVKFEWQQQTIDVLRRINQCGDGEPWEPGCTLYPSKIGAPVVAFIHPGVHEFPAKAPAIIVKFFKQHAKP